MDGSDFNFLYFPATQVVQLGQDPVYAFYFQTACYISFNREIFDVVAVMATFARDLTFVSGDFSITQTQFAFMLCSIMQSISRKL